MDYRLLGRSGLRVSELCLGTMTFGAEWGWGADEAASRAIFDAYAEAGGIFIDTANRYTEGTSERLVGNMIANDRDHFVLATKFTLYDRRNDVSYSGNNRKNMVRSVEESLKRLRTPYIDLLWLHAWDGTAPVDEVMRSLDDMVRSGKVHYIGISDTPAWVVAQCNTLAELRGWSQIRGPAGGVQPGSAHTRARPSTHGEVSGPRGHALGTVGIRSAHGQIHQWRNRQVGAQFPQTDGKEPEHCPHRGQGGR